MFSSIRKATILSLLTLTVSSCPCIAQQIRLLVDGPDTSFVVPRLAAVHYRNTVLVVVPSMERQIELLTLRTSLYEATITNLGRENRILNDQVSDLQDLTRLQADAHEELGRMYLRSVAECDRERRWKKRWRVVAGLAVAGAVVLAL